MTTHVYKVRDTLNPLNQFIITCPVFKANTKIAACFMLRDLWARGEAPGTRRGCIVALNAGKCPIDHILNSMRTKGDDPYFSKEAKVGAIRPEILERIRPVLVLEKAIERAALPPKEAECLLNANEEARSGVKHHVKKPRRADPTMAEIDAKEAGESAKIAASADTMITITEAAKSGDMAAAVSAEIKETGATT